MSFNQMETSECGLSCLAYASAMLGSYRDMADLRQRFPLSGRGIDVKTLIEISSNLDLVGRAVKCELDELHELCTPTILHWRLNHFVVLIQARRNSIKVYNPDRGVETISLGAVSGQFTGIAIEITPAASFKKRREKSPLSIWQWIHFSPRLTSGLTQILVLSLLLQMYVVASPFYLELAVDQGALKGDHDLLFTIAFGFGLFAVFNAIASFLRNVATQQVSTVLSWEMSLRLFRHLVRLPLPWFQKRRLADTISRFDAINPIRDLVSGALISGAIDGVLALVTIVMMVVFDWQLAAIAVLSNLLYVAVKLSTLPLSLRYSGETLRAQIAENGKRIETIKAIQTIKVMSGEASQETQWANKFAEYLKSTVQKQRFDYTVRLCNQLIDAVSLVVIIYVGASQIISGEVTVGILYAFTAYRSQLNSAVTSIVDQAVQWKLSDVYSFRLADIVLTAREEGIDRVDDLVPQLRGEIEIENVSFRYSPYDPHIIKGLSLHINPGEFLAIVGPSGVGKSTLLKLLTGLYRPSSGEVRIDGRSPHAWGPQSLRRALGVVMQDDELLSASIAENVAFFDEMIDMDRVWAALDAAALADEIRAMPLGVETSVGDMGGNLSGGQRQRLLIARALYKRPRILVLDEATSHLDVQNEQKINASLRRLNITRVVIAHRMETIRAADRIFDLHARRFYQLQPTYPQSQVSS